MKRKIHVVPHSHWDRAVSYTHLGEATKELLKQAGDNDNISTIYVVDDNEKYFGAIDLKDMILARKDDKLIEIISQSYPYLLEHDLIDECMDKIVEYSEDSIPVLKITGEIVCCLLDTSRCV